jgi:hypothetical protein
MGAAASAAPSPPASPTVVASVPAQSTFYKVVFDRVNVRKAPVMNGELLGVKAKGMVVEACQSYAGWVKLVRAPG